VLPVAGENKTGMGEFNYFCKLFYYPKADEQLMCRAAESIQISPAGAFRRCRRSSPHPAGVRVHVAISRVAVSHVVVSYVAVPPTPEKISLPPTQGGAMGPCLCIQAPMAVLRNYG
jgi:hypothetical protein